MFAIVVSTLILRRASCAEQEKDTMENKLSFGEKLSRLRLRLREPEWRKYGQILITGKLTGIALLMVLGIIMHPDLIGFGSFAADPDLKGNDIVNPLNTVW